MVNIMEIFIIGAGASGLTAAITLARKGKKVTILEKNQTCGKKLLLTGNARCNYYNQDQDIKKYNSDNKNALKEILKQGQKEVLPFFDSIGIIHNIKNGYYYPYSNQSKSVLNALLKTLQKLNVKIINNQTVIDIKKQDKFIITTQDSTYKADKLIIATGGKTYPQTGSDGSTYKLLKKLGHSTTKLYPGLTKIIGKDNYYHLWAQTRAQVKLTLKINNQTIKEEIGELQMTKNGISGICTFNLSAKVAKALDKKEKVIITINFVPWFNKNNEQLAKWLKKQNETKDLDTILNGFLPSNTIELFHKTTSINKINNQTLPTIINFLTNFTFNPKEVTFKEAQITVGGIKLNEINPQTLESKIVKNLYIIGEILDVQGDCGGYNLGLAWMTGIIVGKHI